jgi:hypothetical protein
MAKTIRTTPQKNTPTGLYPGIKSRNGVFYVYIKGKYIGRWFTLAQAITARKEAEQLYV